jgi:hypothetical protein
MDTKDWLFLLATIVSPFFAAGLTTHYNLKWQVRREQRAAKLEVFSSLMSVRGNISDFQAAEGWVRALHLIDVVFSDSPTVLVRWRELYAMLQHPQPPPGQAHKMIELLSAMSEDLELSLQQLDLDKAHFPRAISEPIARRADIEQALLRVLKNTASLLPDMQSGDSESPLAVNG